MAGKEEKIVSLGPLMMRIDGNSVLITGGASGIGYAMAEFFLETGNEVIITGRRKDRLAEARKLHPELNMMACDMSQEDERTDLLEWVESDFPKFNILINNAGIQQDLDFTINVPHIHVIENEININLTSAIIMSGLCIPLIKGKQDAAIVNISSGLGFIPSARTPVYSATKAGLHAFSMALRYQLMQTGIKVFEIVPPAVDTDLNPEGRAERGDFKAGLTPRQFVEGVMKHFLNDVFEIGYGMTEQLIRASREELDERFRRMNSQW